MIKEIYRYTLLVSVALVLSGCVLSNNEQPAPIDKAASGEQTIARPLPGVPELPSVPEQPAPVIPAKPKTPPEPKERHYDWNGAVQPLVSNMLQADGVNSGSVLLVDSVNNRTNGAMQTAPATEALRNALANNGKFTLVPSQQLADAKQQLGLTAQDSLGSRSKAIGIARKVDAQYVLYSNASGNTSAPTLKMQLMLVQTGEIIWSGNCAVQQTQ